MRARAALFRHLREFFETQTVGLFGNNDARHHVAHPAEQQEGKRKYAFGREEEVVEVDFGDYELALISSYQAPPLGQVTLRWPGGEENGSLDRATFDRIGAVIRDRESQRQQGRKLAS